MDKKLVLILAVSIIIAYCCLGLILRAPLMALNDNIGKLVEASNGNDSTGAKYEMHTPNETNLIIFDPATGRYWRKFVPPNSGPTNWQEEDIPNFSK